jgi:hypothetical protein
LDAHLTAQRLVGFFIAVDGRDFGETRERFGGFLKGRLEALAVAAPGRVEFDDAGVVAAVDVRVEVFAGEL